MTRQFVRLKIFFLHFLILTGWILFFLNIHHFSYPPVISLSLSLSLLTPDLKTHRRLSSSCTKKRYKKVKRGDIRKKNLRVCLEYTQYPNIIKEPTGPIVQKPNSKWQKKHQCDTNMHPSCPCFSPHIRHFPLASSPPSYPSMQLTSTPHVHLPWPYQHREQEGEKVILSQEEKENCALRRGKHKQYSPARYFACLVKRRTKKAMIWR